MGGKKLFLLVVFSVSLALISNTQFSESQVGPNDIFDKGEYLIGEIATITTSPGIFIGDPAQIDTIRISVNYVTESIQFDLVETDIDSGTYTNTMTFSSVVSDDDAQILKVDDSGSDITYIIIDPDSGNIIQIGQVSMVFVIEPSTVKCTHTPIWPQSGEEVTILAQSVNELGNFVVADTVEIWTDGQNLASQNLGAAVDSYSETFTGDSFSYGCRTIDGSTEIFSGWKVASIGLPENSTAIPVQFTGDRSDSIDFIFIPDETSYTDSTDIDFLNDVSTAIGFFLTEQTYLLNQDKINFWLAQDSGVGQGVQPDGSCNVVVPDNWDTDYAFADTGAILHPTVFQDCAFRSLKIFSSEPNVRTLFHEAGHSPFGLADERPNARHIVAEPNPNLYDTMNDCDDDPFNSGKSCRKFISTHSSDRDEDWYTSDPDSNDIMVDNGDFQPLDIRRIIWMFDRCESGEC